MPTTNLTDRNQLAAIIDALAPREGYTQSHLQSVRFMRSNHSMPRAPKVYDPSIIIVVQGQKRGYLGGQTYVYDPLNYLVLSVTLPFECETFATTDEPLLAISISVDPAVIAELLLEMEDDAVPPPPYGIPIGIYSTPMNEALIEAATRLLECLRTPEEARILGPAIVREITYRVLCGAQGESLRQLVNQRSNFAKIAKSLRRIHTNYNEDLDVSTLARDVGMSVSAFHQNFKSVTSSAPLQYIKTIRLHKALMLMAHEGLKANSAAEQVGYESSSQFSREFKRLFGATPAEEAAQLRARLGAAVAS